MTVPGNPSQVSATPDDYSVTVSVELIDSAGLQPEDYGVLLRLVRQSPIWDVKLRSIVAEMRNSDWRMSVDRLSACLKRLKVAGYVQHFSEYNEATKRPVWKLTASLTPQVVAVPKPRTSNLALVYAIRDRRTRHIKIGISVDPEKRLSSMQTGSPAGMDLLWTGTGGRPAEAYLHGRFADRRIRGEWFDFTGCDAVHMIKKAAADFGGGQ
ncbi:MULTISPECIES: GIY-YIG nuclease family protein [unclassified Streptomyces]|uniref:GIY-YIG nuclease family protein n=1 Tax=unclassified Streptomyces TaxID=2593676 RepID=UPI00068F1B96|nr:MULTISPECIES: GIY-YIG nuclease family protein [unclassified Streptomyces]